MSDPLVKPAEAPIDWGKVTEMRTELDNFVKKQNATLKQFNPKEILANTKTMRQIVDDDLGVINYVLLTYADLQDVIKQYPDNADRTVQMIFRQLRPANPDMTVDDVKALPYDVFVRLATRLQKEGSFFQQTISQNGSTTTETPK